MPGKITTRSMVREQRALESAPYENTRSGMHRHREVRQASINLANYNLYSMAGLNPPCPPLIPLGNTTHFFSYPLPKSVPSRQAFQPGVQQKCNLTGSGIEAVDINNANAIQYWPVISTMPSSCHNWGLQSVSEFAAVCNATRAYARDATAPATIPTSTSSPSSLPTAAPTTSSATMPTTLMLNTTSAHNTPTIGDGFSQSPTTYKPEQNIAGLATGAAFGATMGAAIIGVAIGYGAYKAYHAYKHWKLSKEVMPTMEFHKST